MTSTSVQERLIPIVADKLGAKGEITRETSFRDDLGADSLDVVELVMELERQFELQIPDEEAEKIKTVGQAIDYVEARLKQKEAAPVSVP